MNNLCPDHWTISDFRKEHKELIRCITIDFRKFLKDWGSIKGKSISTDGTKIKAYASRDALSLKQINKKLVNVEKERDLYLSQINENDAIENEQENLLAMSEELKENITFLQNQVEELQSQKKSLETAGRQWMSPTDTEAKLMKSKERVIPAYN